MFVAAALTVLIGGCGSVTTSGFQDMRVLASALRTKGSRRVPLTVTCVKSGATTAQCKVKSPYAVEATAFQFVQVTVAADGKTFAIKSADSPP